jgi:hypothetical protein
VVVIGTVCSLKLKSLHFVQTVFFPHNTSHNNIVISLNSITRLTFVIETDCVPCEVEIFAIFVWNLYFKNLIGFTTASQNWWLFRLLFNDAFPAALIKILEKACKYCYPNYVGLTDKKEFITAIITLHITLMGCDTVYSGRSRRRFGGPCYLFLQRNRLSNHTL